MYQRKILLYVQKVIKPKFYSLLPLEFPTYYIDSVVHYAVATQAGEADDPVLTGQEPVHVTRFPNITVINL